MSLASPRLMAVAAALLATAALAGCGDGDTGKGGFVPGRLSQHVAGASVSLRIPTGRLQVRLGRPVDGVGATDAQDGQEHHPAKGSHFVPISWTFSATPGAGVRAVMAQQPQPAELSVVSDGDHYDVAPVYRVAGSTLADTGVTSGYVAVPGDADSLQVAVSYDGVTQSVDVGDGSRDAGAASGLYTSGRVAVPRCSGRDWSGAGSLGIDCHLGAATALPYLPGRGWAAPGRTWLVVPFSASWTSLRRSGHTYDVGTVHSTATLAGRAPVTTPLFGAGPEDVGRTGTTYVFDAPAGAHPGSMTVRLDATLTSHSADLQTGRATTHATFALG